MDPVRSQKTIKAHLTVENVTVYQMFIKLRKLSEV